MPHPHIIQIPGNPKGKDFIGTDPHGCLGTLIEVIKLMKTDDRLFLCGDLIDRGQYSYDLLKFLENKIASGMQILLIRGNHEDMTLNTLRFLDALDMIEKRLEDDDSLGSMMDDNGPNPQRLITLSVRDSEYVLEKYKALRKSAQGNLKKDKNTRKSEMRALELELLNYFEKSSEAFNSLISFAWHLNDGCAWLCDLDFEQRQWVKSFIEPLPYIIRVEATHTENKLITAFDIVHAAPLSEIAMEEALKLECPILTLQQINYITWARPEDGHHKIDLPIQSVERTPHSIRTYVGHTTLSAYCKIYYEINVFDLDTATVVTGCMFIANHTNDEILEVQCLGLITSIPHDYSDCQDLSFDALDFLKRLSPSFIYQKAHTSFFPAPGKAASTSRPPSPL